MESDAFLQVKPYVTGSGIDILDINALVDLLETRFGDVDPVGTAKHELYKQYQTNKNLEVFLNTFFVLAKKAKIDDQQTLDLLFKRLNNKFKSLLVTKKKQTNLDNLIKKLRSMDASMKIISQQKRSTNIANSKSTYASIVNTVTKFSYH